MLASMLAPTWVAAGPPARPRVAVVPSDARVPREVLDALRFELDQAGYDAADEPGSVAVTIVITVDDERWRLDVNDSTNNVQLHAEGASADSPGTIGLVAVELLVESSVESSVEPRVESTEPELAPEPAASGPPDTSPPDTAPSPARGADDPPASVTPEPRARAWALEAGVVGASLGVVGLMINLQRRWPRAAFGLGLEGGFLAVAVTESTAIGNLSTGSGGFVRGRVSGAYVFRSGSRARPHLGGGIELAVPLLRSRFEGDGVLVDGLEYGLALAPVGELGLSVELQPRLALVLALRGGPLFELAELPLADGRSYAWRPWFLAGSVAFRFDLSRASPRP